MPGTCCRGPAAGSLTAITTFYGPLPAIQADTDVYDIAEADGMMAADMMADGATHEPRGHGWPAVSSLTACRSQPSTYSLRLTALAHSLRLTAFDLHPSTYTLCLQPSLTALAYSLRLTAFGSPVVPAGGDDEMVVYTNELMKILLQVGPPSPCGKCGLPSDMMALITPVCCCVHQRADEPAAAGGSISAVDISLFDTASDGRSLTAPPTASPLLLLLPLLLPLLPLLLLLLLLPLLLLQLLAAAVGIPLGLCVSATSQHALAVLTAVFPPQHAEIAALTGAGEGIIVLPRNKNLAAAGLPLPAELSVGADHDVIMELLRAHVLLRPADPACR